MILFPPLDFFRHNTVNIKTGDKQDTIETRAKSESHENNWKREEKEYNNITLTEPIIVADEFVTLCVNFKYLGLCISFNLCIAYDIHQRIVAANALMGPLNEIWKDDHVEIYSKYFLFKTITCNLLLWGCESWIIRKSLSNALKTFLHRSIWRFLRTSMSNVIDKHIKKDDIRFKFYNIPNIQKQIVICQ